MHSVLEEIKAYEALISDAKEVNDPSVMVALSTLEASIVELKDVFDNNTRNNGLIQTYLMRCNTYALSLESLMGYYDTAYRQQYKARQEAERLYKQVYAYSETRSENEDMDFLKWYDYVYAAKNWYLKSTDYIFKDEDPTLKRKIEYLTQFMEEKENDRIINLSGL